jgi:hypothetical protein
MPVSTDGAINYNKPDIIVGGNKSSGIESVFVSFDFLPLHQPKRRRNRPFVFWGFAFLSSPPILSDSVVVLTSDSLLL